MYAELFALYPQIGVVRDKSKIINVPLSSVPPHVTTKVCFCVFQQQVSLKLTLSTYIDRIYFDKPK